MNLRHVTALALIGCTGGVTDTGTNMPVQDADKPGASDGPKWADAPSGTNTAGTLRVTATSSANGGQYAPRNVVAIWIVGPSGSFTRTIGRWADVRKQFLVAWGELLGGIAMLLGFLTRWAALGLVIIQIGAIATVTFAKGFSAGGGAGYEYNLALIGMCLALMLTGGGPVSADQLLFARRRTPAKQHLVHAHHERSGPQALGHPRLEIACAVQLVMQPALAERVRVGRELVVAAPGRKRLDVDRGDVMTEILA